MLTDSLEQREERESGNYLKEAQRGTRAAETGARGSGGEAPYRYAVKCNVNVAQHAVLLAATASEKWNEWNRDFLA